MLNKIHTIIFTSLLLLQAMPLYAGGSVILGEDNALELTADKIKMIFLGKKKQDIDGKQLIPALPDDDTAVKDEFNKKVLKKSSAMVKAYWAKRLFTGKGRPPREYESNELIELVQKDTKIIGVVSKSLLDEQKVRVVHEF